MPSTPSEERLRRKLVQQLERARSRVDLVADALGSIEKDDVWFVISPRALAISEPEPIRVGECRKVDRQFEISAGGLLRGLAETGDAIDAALKVLKKKPTQGGPAAAPKAKAAVKKRPRRS
jgi:hypothetical protein